MFSKLLNSAVNHEGSLVGLKQERNLCNTQVKIFESYIIRLFSWRLGRKPITTTTTTITNNNYNDNNNNILLLLLLLLKYLWYSSRFVHWRWALTSCLGKPSDTLCLFSSILYISITFLKNSCWPQQCTPVDPFNMNTHPNGPQVIVQHNSNNNNNLFHL